MWETGKENPWKPGGVSNREFCPGALSHTHYFDEHSPAVATAITGTIKNGAIILRPGWPDAA